MITIPRDSNGNKSSEPKAGYCRVFINAAGFHHFYPGETIPAEFQALQPTATPEPDLLNFRLRFSTDAGYKRTVGLGDAIPGTNALLITPLISVIMQTPVHYPSLRSHWNSLIDLISLPARPTVSEIANWNKIAQETNTPIKFNSSGKIE